MALVRRPVEALRVDLRHCLLHVSWQSPVYQRSQHLSFGVSPARSASTPSKVRQAGMTGKPAHLW